MSVIDEPGAEPDAGPAAPGSGNPGLDRVGIRGLRNEVSALVQRAAGGERIVITVDGRPTAQLGPLAADGDLTLDDLVAAGLIDPPRNPSVSMAESESSASEGPLHMPADVRLDRLLDQVRGRW
jgi:prevent-host-death family protein